MKYKIFLAISLISLSLPSAFAASAGGNSGTGGGKGVVCKDERGNIKGNVELLDLWEARELRDQKPNFSGQSVEDMADSAIKELAKSVGFRVTSWGREDDLEDSAYSRMHDFLFAYFNPSNKRIKHWHNKIVELTSDSFEDVTPDKCDDGSKAEIMQLVKFKDNLLSAEVNQDLVDRLTPVGQAALAAHEAFYYFLRTFEQEANSLRVRRAVGYVFAGLKFKTLQEMKLAPHVLCWADQYQGSESPTLIYFFPSPVDSDGWTSFNVVPSQIFGSFTIGAATAPLAKLSEAVELAFNGVDHCINGPSRSERRDNLANIDAPVDFDVDADFATTCEKGTPSLFVRPVNPKWKEISEPEYQKLKCSFVK